MHNGQKQRATHIQYDAVPVGSWRTAKQLSYWHCLELDDEHCHWQLMDCH